MGGSFFFARRARGIRGDTEIRRGTLERVPRTPQNFSERIIIAVTRRSCPVPAFSCAPAWRRRYAGGALERVPRTPQNFSERIIIAITQRSRPVPRASPYRTLPPRPPPVPLSTQPRGCKGRSPLHKKTMILPLPAGKGVGGIGAEKQANGKADRQPPGQAPAGRHLPTHLQCRAGTAAGVPGAKPPAKLTYGLPLPAGKSALRARVGGIGAEKQAKGKVDRQPSGQAPQKNLLHPLDKRQEM